MSLQTGMKAPDFTLPDTEKNMTTLSDFRGQNVLVLFFPLAFTGVCTKELCATRDDIARYQELNTQVLAISVDSPFSLGKFKEEQQLNFPLLSDFNREAARAYGALYDEFVLGMKGVAKRSAFVVDKDGVLRYVEVLENAGELPDFEAIKETLGGL
ncbi:MAG TPA: peroxiredoxin [Phaeodactylibacter sp.]|nr:peroxiredoxin [Phaeodactylibacter sp.]